MVQLVLRPDVIKRAHALVSEAGNDPKMVWSFGCLLSKCINAVPSKLLANQREEWLVPLKELTKSAWESYLVEDLTPESWKALSFIRRKYMEQAAERDFPAFLERFDDAAGRIEAAIADLERSECPEPAVQAAKCALMQAGVSEGANQMRSESRLHRVRVLVCAGKRGHRDSAGTARPRCREGGLRAAGWLCGA